MSAYRFADLRLNTSAEHADEGFWPSFTDIMMVVVMIFMLASVIMLLRNMELVDQLRATMEAERQASRVAQATAQQKAQLAERLTEAESDVERLRMELLLAREERAREARKRHETETQLSGVTERAKTLAEQLTQASDRASQLKQQADVAKQQLSALQAEHQSLVSRFRESSQRVSQLEAEQAERQATIAELRESADTSEHQLALTRDEFSRLKQKYDRLIRPARTTAGKHVVEVRYSKPGKDFLTEIRDEGQKSFSKVTSADLHSRLAKLKAENPGKLFVRVLFPEESGLSYNEAWTFTQDLLQKYDYYAQEPLDKEDRALGGER